MSRWLSEPARSVPEYSIMEIAKYASAYKAEDMVYLNIGEPDFDTPGHIREKAIEAIQSGKTHYTPDSGIFELREAIARKLRLENKLNYAAEDITVVSGSQEGISVVTQAILNRGDEVIVSDPYYPSYTQNIWLRGAKPVFVPLRPADGFQLMAEDVDKAVSNKTKAIVIVSPNNPTGGVQSLDQLKGIAEIAIKHDLLVISDEIYEYIVYDGRTHYSIGSLPGMQDRTITQNGFSKSYAMTGWRIGYLATPSELTPKIQEIHRATVICPPSVSQYAALAAITGAKDSVERMVQEFSKRREYVVKRLMEIPHLNVAAPSGAFYVFPDFSAYTTDDKTLAKELIRRAHVVTVHGSGFGERGRGHLRISFAASMKNLEEGLNRIEDYLRKNWPEKF
ncbi:MAG: pyridoxal phosphate-dependent aminotransferase [Thermoprotei archaeon]